MSARSESGSDARRPGTGDERGELFEEQRVAAAALEQPLGDVEVGALARGWPPRARSDDSRSSGLEPERHGRVAAGQRRPVQLGVGTGGRDQDQGLAGERDEHLLEQVEHRGVGPVQIGHRDDHRSEPEARLEHLHDGACDLLAGAGRLVLLERRGKPDQVQERVLDPADLLHVGVRRQQMLHPSARLPPELLRRSRRIDPEAVGTARWRAATTRSPRRTGRTSPRAAGRRAGRRSPPGPPRRAGSCRPHPRRRSRRAPPGGGRSPAPGC